MTGADNALAGYINLPGTVSTSESFRVALQFARVPKDTKESDDLHSVLFAICIHNYDNYNGFRMNSALFSAHPQEKELLLIEGAPAAVLGVDEIYIDNSSSGDDFWKDFNKKTVYVIYLFHATDCNDPEK